MLPCSLRFIFARGSYSSDCQVIEWVCGGPKRTPVYPFKALFVKYLAATGERRWVLGIVYQMEETVNLLGTEPEFAE